MAYTGTIDLISGLRPKNNGEFPLVNAEDVYVDDNTRLDTALDNLTDKFVSYKEPQELSELEKAQARVNIGAVELDDTFSTSTAAAPAYETGQLINGLADDISDLKKYTVKDYVTPEMFGAYGDGLHDDSIYIQTAINTGNPIVFSKKTYKIDNPITLINGTDIDFGNATIKISSDTLFSISSTKKATISDIDIKAGQRIIDISSEHISIGDLLYIKGTNLINSTRDYYVAGIVTLVSEIYLNNIIIADAPPFDVDDGVIEVYAPCTFQIKNIKNVIAENDIYSFLSCAYCIQPVIENINFENMNLVAGLEVSMCYMPIINRCNIRGNLSGFNINCYPISIGGCFGTHITNCIIISEWHSVQLGGVIPCICTSIDNCECITFGETVAIGEHQNSFYTTIKNSRFAGAVLNNFATVENCVIIDSGISTPSYTTCRIYLHGSDVIDVDFVIKNVKFIYNNTEAVAAGGIIPYFNSWTEVSSGKIRNIYLENVSSNNYVGLCGIYYDVFVDNMIVKDSGTLRLESPSNYSGHFKKLIGDNVFLEQLSNLSICFEKAIIKDSDINIVSGNIILPTDAYLENVIFGSTTIRNSITVKSGGRAIFKNVKTIDNTAGVGSLYVNTEEIIAEDCIFKYVNYGSKNVVMRNCMINGNVVNIIRISGESYRCGVSDGVLTLTAI